jgi:hypothetical protein
MEISGIQGDWWVPDYPEAKVAGRLVFNPKSGGYVEAWGPRLGIPISSTRWLPDEQAPIYFDRIFGSTERGIITLLGCRMALSTFEPGAIQSKQTLSCSSVIDGMHVSKESVFSQARARLANLDEWAPLVSLRPDGKFGYTVNHGQGPAVQLQDDVTLSIRPSVSNVQDRRSARIDAQDHLHIAFGRPLIFEDILPTWINPFLDLLTLATSYPSSVIELEVAEDTSSFTVWHKVGLRLGFDPHSKVIGIWAEGAILRFADLDFTLHIPRWYDMAHKLQGVFNYTFGARYSTDISSENRYLNATTAAEAVHRELVRSKRKSVDLDDPAVKSFLESFPEDEQELLSDRTKHLNDESFHQRLQYIYNKTRPFSSRIAPNGDKWVTTVKKVRNNLTHQSGNRTTKVPAADQLFALGESVFLLISAYILVELGFDPEVVNEWLSRERNSRYIINYLQAAFPQFHE